MPSSGITDWRPDRRGLYSWSPTLCRKDLHPGPQLYGWGYTRRAQLYGWVHTSRAPGLRLVGLNRGPRFMAGGLTSGARGLRLGDYLHPIRYTPTSLRLRGSGLTPGLCMRGSCRPPGLAADLGLPVDQRLLLAGVTCGSGFKSGVYVGLEFSSAPGFAQLPAAFCRSSSSALSLGVVQPGRVVGSRALVPRIVCVHSHSSSGA